MSHAFRLAVGTVAAVLVLTGCQPVPPARAKHAREIMGTFAEVTALARDVATARGAVDAAYARLSDVNRMMSDYLPDSDIGRLNAANPGGCVVVSAETYFCLERAIDVSVASGGAFDVTCRPLVWLWKDAAKAGELPTPEAIDACRERIGWTKLQLDPSTRGVIPTAGQMQIDLGGIAKGYALDLAAEAMRAAGATGGLVNVGGDVLAFGAQAADAPWRIGVQHPFQDGLFCTLALRDCAVATSGVQQRFVEIGGRRYSHIVDPRTGRPAEQAPSVTVIAADGLTADAWATVFSVLSIAEGKALIAEGAAPPIEVLWLTREGDNVVVEQTAGFAAYVAE